MRIFSPLRGGLLFAECARFSFLTGILVVLRHSTGPVFPWQIYAVPNALFILMALFLWLDFSEYAVFSLLYISGKSLCLFSEISSWIVLSKNQDPANFDKFGFANPVNVLAVIFLIDLLTLIITLIIRIKNKISEPVLSAPGQIQEYDETGCNGGV